MTTLFPGRILGGRYRLERPLGRGGMGAVWAARHTQLDTHVAIKCIVDQYAESEDLRARFEREAKAAAQMRSPHVCQVHDYGVEDGVPYLVMELLTGEDLDQRLDREDRLSLSATQEIAAQLCRGLHHAHEAGIIHRDLKPPNVFLARVHGEETVKILDFGLAKMTDKVDALTRSGMLMGTPHYMSPEQARPTRPIDRRSDLWSVGVILYRCITGQLPFPGDVLTDVLMGICGDPLPMPSSIDPSLGPAIDVFFERALSRDVARRYQSAIELARAFKEVVAMAEIAPPSTVRAPAIEPDLSRTVSLPTAAHAGAGEPWARATSGVAASAAATPAPATPSTATPAPSGRDLPTPPPQSSSSGAALAVVGVTIVAGIAAAALLLHRGEPSSSPSAASTPVVSAQRAPEPSAEPRAPEPAPSAAAPEVTTAESSAPPPSASLAPPAPAAQKKRPAPAKTSAPAGRPPSMFGF